MPPTTPTMADHMHTPPMNHTHTPTPPHTHHPTTQPTDPPPTNTNHHGYTHLPLPTLQQTEIRLISHNINTLQTTNQAELGATFDLYQELDPTIIGIQECNKNWSLYDRTDGPTREVIKRRWTGAKIVTAHCKEKVFTGPHQPGGIAQMTLKKITGRVVSHGKDTLGRYAWQEILLNGERTLIVITAYRIPQDSLTGCGPETSAMQQWRSLRSQGIEIPKPRQQVLDDLITFIKPHEAKGNEVIIMMDANSPTTDPAMEEFMDALKLHDLMADYLPATPPKTYQRGRHKIDHIVGTLGVLMP